MLTEHGEPRLLEITAFGQHSKAKKWHNQDFTRVFFFFKLYTIFFFQLHESYFVDFYFTSLITVTPALNILMEQSAVHLVVQF